MRYAIVLLGLLAMTACDKNKDNTGSTTTTGATASRGEHKLSQSVRDQMRRDQPASATIIQDIVITDDGETVTMTGIVPDIATHDELVKSAQNAPGVKHVQDNLRVGSR